MSFVDEKDIIFTDDIKRSVGLIVMTQIPGGKLVAVLQRRGSFNTEKMAPESYPNCLQVTCHGGVKEDESFEFGLEREIVEELGEVFAAKLKNWGNWLDEPAVRFRNKKKEIATYGVFVPSEWLPLIRLGPDTGGLVYVAAKQVKEIVKITDEMKANGPEFARTMAMFKDDIGALKTCFKFFGNI